MSSTATNMDIENNKNKPQTRKSGLSTMVVVAAVIVILVVAAAITVPLVIIYRGSSSSAVDHNLKISFTAAGDISDYDEANKTAILSTLSDAAGFAAVPTAATLTVSSASVKFVATFPGMDAATLATAKERLSVSMSDQVTAQTLLEAGISGIIIESAPKVESLEEGAPAPPPMAPFALNGHWKSDWNAFTYTDNDKITMGSSSTGEMVKITTYTDTYYITQKPATDAYNPRKYQKHFFHTAEDGSVAVCTSMYDGTTEDDAIAHDGTDNYDPDGTKCGSFEHTYMTPYTIPVAGSWSTPGAWGSDLTIDNEQWKSVARYEGGGTTIRKIRAFGENFALAQMPADDSYNPSKWIKIEWHDKTASGFEYCTTVMSAATILDALHHDDTKEGYQYNKTDSEGGCGVHGFSHSDANSARRLRALAKLPNVLA